MYTPAPFKVDDPRWIEAFIAEYPFATLAAAVEGRVEATHLPLNRLDGRLCGHLAAGNPLARLADGAAATAVFHGPHAYVSPKWYQGDFNVPTWNYAAVHCSGRLRYVDDRDAAWTLFQGMVDVYEGDKGWRLPEEERYRAMLKGIRFFYLDECRFEAKAKFNQNKSAGDIAAVVEALEAGGEAAAAAFMRRETRELD